MIKPQKTIKATVVIIMDLMSNLPHALLVQIITPGRTQVLQSRQKLIIKRPAIQKTQQEIILAKLVITTETYEPTFTTFTGRAKVTNFYWKA